MRRREFIAGLTTAAMPLRALGQERERRIGVLMYTTADEPDSQARITALAQRLQEAVWQLVTTCGSIRHGAAVIWRGYQKTPRPSWPRGQT